MTVKEIERRIQDIRDTAWDDEAAHAKEDRLREDFIRYVADLEAIFPWIHACQKARLVLATNEISFHRWTA